MGGELITKVQANDRHAIRASRTSSTAPVTLPSQPRPASLQPPSEPRPMLRWRKLVA